MKNQVFAGILILALMLPLVGCGTVSVDQTDTSVLDTSHHGIEPSETETIPNNILPESNYPLFTLKPDLPVSDEEMNITVQYLPETVENPDNLPVLKWLCLVDSTTRAWTEDAVHELNQMLADRDMQFRVQFVLLSTAYSFRYSDWFNRPAVQEALADADLIHGMLTYNDRQTYLLPITEYVTGNAQPSLKKAVPHELNWIAASVDGEIYGIESWPTQSNSNGWLVDPEFLSANGLTAKDFNRNFWEMDEIFAKVYKENGNTPFLSAIFDGYIRPNITTVDLSSALPSAIYEMVSYSYQFVGASFGIDHNAGEPTIVNILEANMVRNIWSAIMRYREAGYISNDVDLSQLTYGTVVGSMVYNNTNGKICIPVTQPVFGAAYSQNLIIGVAATSQHKDAAISFLSQIAEDEILRNQLLFGKEGRDYTLTDGNYSAVKQEDGSYYSMDFLSPYSYFSSVMDNERTFFISHEGKTKLQTYQDDLDNTSIYYYPIVFDYTGFEQEIEAITKILNIYYYFYSNHEQFGEPEDADYVPKMTEELYDQMLQELKAAGSDKIIAELQRQLDEWLAENPDWQ